MMCWPRVFVLSLGNEHATLMLATVSTLQTRGSRNWSICAARMSSHGKWKACGTSRHLLSSIWLAKRLTWRRSIWATVGKSGTRFWLGFLAGLPRDTISPTRSLENQAKEAPCWNLLCIPPMELYMAAPGWVDWRCHIANMSLIVRCTTLLLMRLLG